ncbi:MAG TPA: zf-HC2 domain-containing protein, partial [Anaerolineae bacterium]|nr:zf-HC2 domain-containing protein [Anaerolineae bacterium]
MDCVEAQRWLQEYLDGALAGDRARDVAAHVERCSRCGHDLALLRRIDAALAAQPAVEEPAHLAAEIMARIQVSPTAPRPVFRPSWEDAAVSLLFAATMVTLLSALSRWQPDLLLQAWRMLDPTTWTWLTRPGELWRAVLAEPFYVAWLLASLCVAALVAAGAQFWLGRPGRLAPHHDRL